MPAAAEAPLVSVVIASYNTARYLPLAVRSALAQTYPAVEVQVVDDGSTDETPRVMEPFLADPRVHYHRQDNAGQANAKNRGVRESRGDLVAFLDADDVWLPRKLAVQVPLFGDEAVGVVYSHYQFIDENGDPVATIHPAFHRGVVTAPLFINNFVGFNTSVVRRRLLEEHGAFDESIPMGIDWELWLRLSTVCHFDFVDEALIQYRVWAGQMSKNYRGRYDNAFRIMDRFLATHPGLVDGATVRDAYAHTHANKASAVLHHEGFTREALAELLAAVRYRPLFWPAWKVGIKALTGRR